MAVLLGHFGNYFTGFNLTFRNGGLVQSHIIVQPTVYISAWLIYAGGALQEVGA